MKTDNQHIDKQQLIHILAAEYGVQIPAITFVPKGEEAWTYVAQTAAREQYFVRVQPAVSATNLERVFPIVYALHQQHGLTQAVAPLKTCHNTPVVSVDDYIVAVFPYIEGQTLHQRAPTAADLTAAAALLARLHQLLPDAPGLRREDFANPFKAPIMRALDAARTPAAEQTFLQQQVCSLLNAERADILATLERMERLQSQAQQLVTHWVLTHGDPNRDNFLKDQQGTLHLTDWSDLAVGPPERDLALWTGDWFEVFLQAYVRRRPSLKLHRELFEFYFYRWSVQEIADYATRILFRRLGPAEDEHAWAELQDYLPVKHQGIAQGVEHVQSVIERVLG